jgi:hypothetical protein
VRKFIIIALLAGGIAACDGPSVTITGQQAVEGITAVDAILVTATNYLKLPLCPAAALCRTQGASAAIAKGARTLVAAKNAALVALRASPSGIPVSYTTALATAVTGLNTLYQQYGVTP